MSEQDEIFKMFQEELDKRVQELNSIPNPDIDYLSPDDLYRIIYLTLEENSPIGFKKNIPKSALEQIPFLNLIIDYLQIVNIANELKLTARGNLPKKICLELYGKGYIKEYAIEKGITKLSKEGDSISLQNLKIICDFAGLTKKRNNKLTLTKNGKLLLERKNYLKILKLAFTANFQKFNLGYHDGYNEDTFTNQTFGYTLYLLLRYGQRKRKIEFYIDKKLKAYPHVLELFSGSGYSSPKERFASCYSVRYFERFLEFYGFVELNEIDKFKTINNEINTTDVFRNIFEIKKKNFKFRKTKHSA